MEEDMGLILIDRHGKRTWCKKHEELHRGKRCPKCAAADKRHQTKLKKLAAWFAEARIGTK